MWTKPCKDMGKELHGGSPLFRETQRMISVAGGEWEEQKLPSPPPFNIFLSPVMEMLRPFKGRS